MYHVKLFFVRHKTFLINYFVNMYFFSVQQWTYLVHMSLWFWWQIFLLPQNIDCDSHKFGAQRNFFVKYFFCWHSIVFYATRKNWKQNVSIKNIVSKQKQILYLLRKSKNTMLFSTFWLHILALEKSVAFCRNGNIAWFFILLIHIRLLDVISNHSNRNLLGFHMFQVGNKNTRARCERCLKLKLKNTRTTLSNGFLFFIVDY